MGGAVFLAYLNGGPECDRYHAASPDGITTRENVIVSPPIVESLGRECSRVGHWMVAELDRFLAGKPLLYTVGIERLSTMA